MRKSMPPKTEFERVCDHFETWRKSKPYKSSPIPEELWREAVDLARTHSIYKICKVLRLDFKLLKRRVQESYALPESLAEESGGFVELSLGMPSQPSECLIELDRSDGMRMRLSIKGAVDPRLCDLAKEFWSRS